MNYLKLSACALALLAGVALRLSGVVDVDEHRGQSGAPRSEVGVEAVGRLTHVDRSMASPALARNADTAGPLPPAPLSDLDRATGIDLIRKAIAAEESGAPRQLILRALENALVDRRTDVPTAFSVAELLSSSADSVGYLESVAHTLANNLTQREDGPEPAAALEAAYTTLIEKLLSQQRTELAGQLLGQMFGTVAPSGELVAVRARVLSGMGDQAGAIHVLRSVAEPTADILAQLEQYLRQGDPTTRQADASPDTPAEPRR